MFRIGVDGWKILRCINTDGEITVTKACELIRDMLAGRSYRLPYWDVSGEVVIPE